MPVFKFNSNAVIFFHVPKCGGTSVEDFLSQRSTMDFFSKNSRICGVPPQHLIPKKLFFLYRDLEGLSSFAIVRHPLKRMMSEFRYRKNLKVSNINFIRFILFSRVKSIYKPSIYSNHIRSQLDFILPNTKIFKLEEGGVENAIKYALDALKIKHVNCDSIPMKNQNYKEGFDPSFFTRLLVFLLYYREFKFFNYRL